MRYEKIVIKSSKALIGRDLDVFDNVQIFVEDGVISSIGSLSIEERRSGYMVVDCVNGILIPSLINSHTHTADYGFQEVGYDLDIDTLVGEPYGLKYIYLEKFRDRVESNIYRFLKNSLESGALIIADFREGGLDGFIKGINASKRIKEITYIPMYMPIQHKKGNGYSMDGVEEDIKKIRSSIIQDEYIWIAISSPHYYTHNDLNFIDRLAFKYRLKIASHLSETREVKSIGDKELVKDLKNLKLIVHGYWLDLDDLEYFRDKGVYLSICPRSALWFNGVKVDLNMLKSSNIPIVVGTDNGSWIKPDLWRELELLAIYSRIQGGPFKPSEILKMATVNPGDLFGIPNYIDEGIHARMICLKSRWIDARSSKDPVINILKHGGVESIYRIIAKDIVLGNIN